MKSILLLFTFILFYPTQEIFAQKSNARSNPLYIQAGAGLEVFTNFEQISFQQTKKAKSVYLETGLAKGLWRVGAYYKNGQEHEFYVHRLSEDHMGLYAKLNLGSFVQFIPYGIEPFIHGSAGMRHSSFTSFDPTNPIDLALATKSTHTSLVNSVGGGVDIGRKLFVLGLQYSYTPGKEIFIRDEGAPLNFYTSNHSFEIKLGIRMYPLISKNGIRCPRFGKRKKGSTSF